jgi:hypothetical protein
MLAPLEQDRDESRRPVQRARTGDIGRPGRSDSKKDERRHEDRRHDGGDREKYAPRQRQSGADPIER